MSKILYLGNFAWSLSIYRKLEMRLLQKFEEVEIWIAGTPKSKESPFLDYRNNLSNAKIRVITKSELRNSANYKEVDLLIACGFPYRIPVEILKQENLLGINLHPSLLPKFWGPDPIRNQILKNDNKYGVSLQFIGEHFDAGLVIDQDRADCSNQACIYEILFKLSYVAVTLVKKFLDEKNSDLLGKFIRSNDCYLDKDQYAASVDVDSFKDEPLMMLRLKGTEQWLRKLMQNGK